MTLLKLKKVRKSVRQLLRVTKHDNLTDKYCEKLIHILKKQ